VKFLLLATALVAGACASEATQPEEGAGSPQQAQVGDTIRLRAGSSARIGTSGVVVAFRGIVADSRCPIDAVCVWAGDAEARIQLTSPGTTGTSVTLHSFTDPKSVTFGGFTFRLVEVAPPNVSTRRTDAKDYVIALEVTDR
jgi:hypothetical protein